MRLCDQTHSLSPSPQWTAWQEGYWVIESKLTEHLVNDQFRHSRFKHAQVGTSYVRTAGPISGVFVGTVHFADHRALRGLRLVGVVDSVIAFCNFTCGGRCLQRRNCSNHLVNSHLFKMA